MTDIPDGGPPGPAWLAWLNAAEASAAQAVLRRVCDSRAWVDGVLGARPFADADALLSASDAAVAELTATDLAEALAGHPPIGRPAPGDASAAREQAGMATASEALRSEMRRLNLAYQERFGHVFLVCATGLTAEQLRDALRARLRNTPQAEWDAVRVELGRINHVRLTRLTSPSHAAEAR